MGTVSLSLDVADATVDGASGTLSWSVASQPWGGWGSADGADTGGFALGVSQGYRRLVWICPSTGSGRAGLAFLRLELVEACLEIVS